MSQSPVPVVSTPQPPAAQTLVCANCGGALAGEFCGSCGQRHEPHVHTLAHFAGEAFESVTHADSRLWRTLWYLLARPGYLTHEFFAGRRARYLPPFRLYLVISVLFFLVVGFTIPTGLRINIDSTGDAEQRRVLEEVATQLEAPGDGSLVKERAQAAQVLREQIAQRKDARAAGAPAPVVGPDGKPRVVPVDIAETFCDEFKDEPDSGIEARDHLRDSCRSVIADGGKELATKVMHNLPRAMFLFLPLVALLMKLLYWRPKRYYVEHLLFLVHNHAFVFLAIMALILVGQIPHAEEGAAASAIGWLDFAIILYMVWYVFRGMRVVYGQGRGLTFAKYFMLGFNYLIFTFVLLLLVTLYSGMT